MARIKPTTREAMYAREKKRKLEFAEREGAQAKKLKQKDGRVILNSVPDDPLDVYVFGSGDAGELGLGTKKATEKKTPCLNANLQNAVQVSIGGMHGIALTIDNQILTWGVNDLGALGRETTWDGKTKDIDDEDTEDEEVELNPYEAMPTSISFSKFPEGTIFTQVAAGDSTSFALTDDGLVYGWGMFRDSKGDYGFSLKSRNEVDTQPRREPKLIPGLKNIKQIAVGGDHALALDWKGVVFAWGTGEQSQLGRRLLERHKHNSLIPTHVALPKGIEAIFAGANHSFAIDKNSKVYAWGLNNFGQCGITHNAGDPEAVIIKPEPVRALDQGIEMVAGGNHHSIALTKDGDCLVWGRLDSYQMGIKLKSLPLEDEEQVKKSDSGRPCILLTPTKVPNVPRSTYVTAGSDHCIVITQNGQAYSWGFNAGHQCGQGPEGGEDDDSDEDDDLDEIKEATVIAAKAIKGKELVWAGAGGQFSAVAAF